MKSMLVVALLITGCTPGPTPTFGPASEVGSSTTMVVPVKPYQVTKGTSGLSLITWKFTFTNDSPKPRSGAVYAMATGPRDTFVGGG